MKDIFTKSIFILAFVALCSWGVYESGTDDLARAKQFDACNTGDEAGCREAIADQYRQCLNPPWFGGKGPYTLRMEQLQAAYLAATGKRIAAMDTVKAEVAE